MHCLVSDALRQHAEAARAGTAKHHVFVLRYTHERIK